MYRDHAAQGRDGEFFRSYDNDNVPHPPSVRAPIKMAAEVRNRKLKEQAVAFYKQHDVTGALERLLNTMFLDSPTDVYGYMVSTS